MTMLVQPKMWWELSRASGLVAWTLLGASVAFGLVLSTKLAQRWNAAALALHREAALASIVLGACHALFLLGDQHTTFDLFELLLPFGAAYRPLAVGLGQIAAYGALLLAGSFRFRRLMGYRAWRALHYASPVVFVLATTHAVAVGSDRAVVPVGFALLAFVLFVFFARITARAL